MLDHDQQTKNLLVRYSRTRWASSGRPRPRRWVRAASAAFLSSGSVLATCAGFVSMVEAVTAANAACALIAPLRAQHGEVCFYQSHGGCDGSAPICLAPDETLRALAAPFARFAKPTDVPSRWRHPAVLGVIRSGPSSAGGSDLPLRQSAQKTTAFKCGGGQAEAAGPFRARHANTRHGPVPAKHRRRASRAKPCPTPQPRPGGNTGGRRATRQRRVLPAGRARATPGRRDPASAASKPCPTRPGLWGRAGRGARGAEAIAAPARSLAACSRAPP